MTTRAGSDLLASYRPSDEDLAELWPENRRTALLERVVAEPRPAPSRPRAAARPRRRRCIRWAVVAAAVLVTALALLVTSSAVKPGLPGGPDEAAAATLRRLAVINLHAGGRAIGSHEFGYLEIANHAYHPNSSTLERFWQAPGGQLWRQVVTSFGGAHPVGCYHYTPPPQDRHYPNLNLAPRAVLATVPTTANGLRHYLDTHVLVQTGGASRNQLVFEATMDLVNNPSSPPKLRAAAIRVMALDPRLTGVTTHARDSRGRAAVILTLTYTTDGAHGRESLYFSPRTGQLLQDDYTKLNGTLTGRDVTVNRSIQRSVPSSLLACIAAKDPIPTPR